MHIVGRCHCGNLSYWLETRLTEDQLPVRACDCTFCRAHGARCTSDPAGSVSIAASRPAAVSRYRFALGTAEFLVCRNCGVYVAAVIEARDGSLRATVNLGASDLHDWPAEGVSYAGETPAARIARRLERWTPVVELRL